MAQSLTELKKDDELSVWVSLDGRRQNIKLDMAEFTNVRTLLQTIPFAHCIDNITVIG